MMFSFFRRLRKDSETSNNGNAKECKDKRNKEITSSSNASSTSVNKDMCKNNLTIQKVECAPQSGNISVIPNAVIESRLLESVGNACIRVSSDEVAAKPEKKSNAVNELNDPKFPNLSASFLNSKNHIMEVSQNVTSDVSKQVPSPVTSYANVLKANDGAKPVKSSHGVKPCGHGTIAISPYIPLALTKKENTGSPPSSPELGAKPKYMKLNSQSRRGSLNVVNTQSSAVTTNSTADKLRNKQPVSEVVNDTVTAAMKLRLEPSKQPTNLIQKQPLLNNATNNQEDTDKAEKKNLINQEAQFQSQLNDLSKQLSVRDAEASRLRFQMEELQRDVFAKTAGMDRLQAELQAANKESEFVRIKLKHVEDDLQNYKQRSAELSEEITQKTDTFANFQNVATEKIAQLQHTIKQLKDKIDSLETQIDVLEREKDDLEKQKMVLMQQREEEKIAFDAALDQATQDKITIENKWKEDFEKMRTVNIVKEQELLNDFEWKLREIEQRNKKKLMESDKTFQEQLHNASADADTKFKKAEEIMHTVENLKSYESEVKQLRGLTSDQQKSLTVLQQQQDEMKNTEKSLKDETRRLRTLIDMEQENLQHMQRIHNQEIFDKERKLKLKLEDQKTQIALYWEERLLHECGRLKSELEQLYNEEKYAVVETIKSQKEREFNDSKRTWERKIQDCLKEVATLKKSLKEKDEYYRREIERTQANTDRDLFELRRIMDKIDMTHHERFEKLVQEHDTELEKINEEHEQRLRELENNWQLQVTSMRTTLELVKEQMEKESQQKIQHLIEQHRAELDSQWANLIHQKSEAVRLVEEEYINKHKTLEEQFYTQQKSHTGREVDLLKTIDSLNNEVTSKDSTIDDLQNNVDTLEGGIQVLNQEIAHQGENLMKSKIEADHKIRGLQETVAKLQTQQQREREDNELQISQLQNKLQSTIDQLQRKCSCLTKLFEEVRSRYERRESRQEDLNVISDLRQVIAEQEKDLACLNEEKRYFQMKLINLERYLHDRDLSEDESRSESQESYADSFCEGPSTTVESSVTQSQTILPNQCGASTSSLTIPPTIPECEDDYD